MPDWNSDLYRQFEDERTRPAIELLARVPLEQPSIVVDLGCGPGNSTELLTARFPKANVTGIDTSDDMLKSARERLPNVRFEKMDIADWQPTTAPDVIYANAALHWVSDHHRLIPRLFATLAPGGVLAFQVPDNRAEPSHQAMRETAAAGPWAQNIGTDASERIKILAGVAYYDLLASQAADVDIWRTIYHHRMASAAAIVNWVRATALRPYIDPLSETQRAEFLAAYEKKIAAVYPIRPDGKAILFFPRLFVVARRKG